VNVKASVVGAYTQLGGVVTINGTLTAEPSKYVNIEGCANCFKNHQRLYNPDDKTLVQYLYGWIKHCLG